MTDYPNNIPAKLEIIKASEIIPKEVRWLWYPYIPFGKVTLLQGDPGDGKSIQAIYAFDLNMFRKNRTECQRTQPLSESACDDGSEQGESMSALLKKFSSALSACDKYSFQADPRFAWVDEMENDELYRKIISLPERDLDLLTLIALEGYSQREVAEIRGIAPAAICKKIAKLKKILYGG